MSSGSGHGDLADRAVAMEAALRLVGMTEAANVMRSLICAASLGEGSVDTSLWRVALDGREIRTVRSEADGFVSVKIGGIGFFGYPNGQSDAVSALKEAVSSTFRGRVRFFAPGELP